jgi:arylsulfatase A-like enzyme
VSAARTGLACLALGIVSACASEPTASPPNLLLVVFDTVRADHTAVGGYERDTTPSLRRLAGQGVSFETAYAPISITGPSHATLFSSLEVRQHGLERNAMVLDPQVETLAERLAARGMQTAGVVSSFALEESFGLAQGFAMWDDAFPIAEAATKLGPQADGRPREKGLDRRADFTTDRALAWLEGGRDPARPFFLFVHYMDPHVPYEAPPPWDARFGDDALARRLPTDTKRRIYAGYDAEIAFADAQLGRLVEKLDALGLGAETIVVVTSDHGEGLGDHGVWTHAVSVYEEQVRVPLVVRWTGRIAPGRAVREPVGLVDVVPTLLELMGLPAESGLAGRSFAAALRGDAPLDAERPVFLYRRHYEPPETAEVRVLGAQDGVRVGRWKWVEGDRDGTRLLFDLERDPAETRNQAALEPARAAELSALLARWREGHGAKLATSRPLREEEVEKLRALGYVQ